MKTENIALFSNSKALSRTQTTIGALLVDAGRITVEDAERVLRLQRDEKLLFGDAALKLKLITQADIDFALSRQFSYEYLQRGTSKVAESVVAAYEPFSEQVEAFRTLRSHLMLRWFDGDPSRKTLAIVSSEPREGRSFVAANLAVVFAQLGERVLLVDADFRKPCQHKLFGVENRNGLSAVLSGREIAPEIQPIEGLQHLSVLTSGALPPNPVELLSRDAFNRLMDEAKGGFDIVLIDSPPAYGFADAQAVAARAGAALLVARKNRSRFTPVRHVADCIVQSGASIVGAVMNEF